MSTFRVRLVRALEASLRRLGTDYVYLFQCHVRDEATPTEETISALGDLVRAGKVRYWAPSAGSAGGLASTRSSSALVTANSSAPPSSWSFRASLRDRLDTVSAQVNRPVLTVEECEWIQRA